MMPCKFGAQHVDCLDCIDGICQLPDKEPCGYLIRRPKGISKCGWADNKGNCSNDFITSPYCIGPDNCVVILLKKQREKK